MGIIALIFLILAIVVVIAFLFPNWNFAQPSFTPNRVIGLLIALIILFLIYLLVSAMFGPGPALSTRG